ncbi:hypothetical protein AB1Y20_012897 [Prymnesium parvum]|uniref:Uncharacterized protein n=1 Tax=Prymnesium parvum TaxID=97485 RepID=A0AB34IK48_PRYPA
MGVGDDASQRKRSRMLHALAAAVVGVTAVSAWLVRGDIYEGRSVAHVWWHGWVTAVFTGLGALPAGLCLRASKWWMGLANALAAGMMCAASCALLGEGFHLKWEEEAGLLPWQALVLGSAAGAAFVAMSQRMLDQCGDVHMGIIEGVDARKACPSAPHPPRSRPPPPLACPSSYTPSPTSPPPPLPPPPPPSRHPSSQSLPPLYLSLRHLRLPLNCLSHPSLTHFLSPTPPPRSPSEELGGGGRSEMSRLVMEELGGDCVRAQALLIVAVMAVHSFSEGIAIGVSFRGSSPPQLGVMVSSTLAVHNIPEGFAVSVPLMAKGVSTLGAALWSIGTSVPQPLMAVLAFYFVDTFVLIQPIGLGFAAGAMLWVALVELFPESIAVCGLSSTALVGAASAAIMTVSHEYLL